MKHNTLIWFTGVISKYHTKEYDISKLEINTNMLRQLKVSSNLIFIISVKDEVEQQQYQDLLDKLRLTDCKAVYIPYDTDLVWLFAEIIQKVGGIHKYIDYSKSRLSIMGNYLGDEQLIHISQLLD